MKSFLLFILLISSLHATHKMRTIDIADKSSPYEPTLGNPSNDIAEDADCFADSNSLFPLFEEKNRPKREDQSLNTIDTRKVSSPDEAISHLQKIGGSKLLHTIHLNIKDKKKEKRSQRTTSPLPLKGIVDSYDYIVYKGKQTLKLISTTTHKKSSNTKSTYLFLTLRPDVLQIICINFLELQTIKKRFNNQKNDLMIAQYQKEIIQAIEEYLEDQCIMMQHYFHTQREKSFVKIKAHHENINQLSTVPMIKEAIIPVYYRTIDIIIDCFEKVKKDTIKVMKKMKIYPDPSLVKTLYKHIQCLISIQWLDKYSQERIKSQCIRPVEEEMLAYLKRNNEVIEYIELSIDDFEEIKQVVQYYAFLQEMKVLFPLLSSLAIPIQSLKGEIEKKILDICDTINQLCCTKKSQEAINYKKISKAMRILKVCSKLLRPTLF